MAFAHWLEGSGQLQQALARLTAMGPDWMRGIPATEAGQRLGAARTTPVSGICAIWPRNLSFVLHRGSGRSHEDAAESYAEEGVMFRERDSWVREGFVSHEGVVGVLLADGSEPGPVYVDMGSGGHVHQLTDWWVYDGTLGRPTAASMRGRCACGLRGTATYAIDWVNIPDDDLDDADVSGPYGDWSAHLDDVADHTVRLPDDLAVLLEQAGERIGQLMDQGELALVLRASDELETIVAAHAPPAARALAQEERSSLMPATAQDLGLTEEAARPTAPLRPPHLASLSGPWIPGAASGAGAGVRRPVSRRRVRSRRTCRGSRRRAFGGC
ncbi:hypothetical protein ACIQHY_34265 [Streptomyces sp. NPDC092359]|uniref:hypothetical protein n=1 Tax=Streptomyces sp. NPDC092359 TaxID=3366014 RepID=UPI0038180FF1